MKRELLHICYRRLVCRSIHFRLKTWEQASLQAEPGSNQLLDQFFLYFLGYLSFSGC
jgi:hypothetical protein